MIACAVFGLKTGRAFADCGVYTGSPHSMAGLVVDSQYIDWESGTTQQSNNTLVRITTHPNTATPEGNIVRLNSSNSGVIAREREQVFGQVWNGECAWGDNYVTVLGYNNTSPSTTAAGPWALDCDLSLHSDWVQSFFVTGEGVPDGARPGGTWTTVNIGAPNGDTAKIVITYIEPPLLGDGWSIFEQYYNNDTCYISGWAVDIGSPTFSTTVHVYWNAPAAPGGHVIGTTANQSWGGVQAHIINTYRRDPGGDSSPGHGFHMRIPDQYRDGVTRTAYVYSLIRDNSNSWQLNGSPVTFKCTSVVDGWRTDMATKTENLQGRPFSNTRINIMGEIGGSSTTNPYSWEVRPYTPTGAPTFIRLQAPDPPPPGWQLVGYTRCDNNDVGTGPGKFTRTQVDDGTCNKTKDPRANPYNNDTAGFNPPVGYIHIWWFYAPIGNAFTLTPVAQTPEAEGGNEENPIAQYYRTYVTGSTGIPSVGIQATATRTITYKRGSSPYTNLVSPISETRRFGPNQTPIPPYEDYIIASPPGGWQAGDQFCVVLTISPAAGNVDTFGNVASVTTPSLASGVPAGTPTCERVVNKPYVQFFGNDVRAGSGYTKNDGSCDQATGNITAFHRQGVDIPPAGAGVQFAAFARGAIQEFATSILRNGLVSAPQQPEGLAFANTGGGESGKFGAVSCIPDYFSSKPTTPTTNTDVYQIPNTPTKESIYIKPSAPYTTTLSLGGGNYGTGARKVLYVEGDVLITGNITYSGTWTKREDIPAIYVIAKGNIYISKDVTQLDGVYIAQPDPAKLGSGTLNTCVVATPKTRLLPTPITFYLPTPITNMGDLTNPGQINCLKKLTFNGAIIAQRVKLLRTFSSLRNAQYTESSATSNAAEIFNFSPEVYLANDLPLPLTGGVSKGKYNSATTLPPVL